MFVYWFIRLLLVLISTYIVPLIFKNWKELLLSYIAVIIFGTIEIAGLTWRFVSQDISLLFSIVVLVVLQYFFFCRLTVAFYKSVNLARNSFINTFLARLTVYITSIFYVFWIVTLLGKFLNDSNIFETFTISNSIPKYEKWYEYIINLSKFLSHWFQVVFEFFVVGVKFLLTEITEEKYELYISLIKGVYVFLTGTVIPNVIMFTINTKYENVDISKQTENKE